MRTSHALKNIFMGIISQIVIVLLGFVSRKVFLDSLGTEYLGINGLLTNVLSSMVLIEGGIGISIVYNLYKPLAEDDKTQIISLVQLYRNCYYCLSAIVFAICFFLYLFLHKFINMENEIPYLSFVYWIFVVKSIISYLFAYKVALINADQKGYVLQKINLIFQILILVGKIIILVYFKNYIIFLLFEMIFIIIQNLINSRIINRLYPYIVTSRRYYIKDETKYNIINNVKAMFIQNIGSYAIYSTDNIIISMLVNVKAVGLYSNYSMIIDQLASLIKPIISGVGNSVGNLIATESSQKSYEIFKVTNMMCFLIYSTCAISLYNLLDIFISWWIGEEYLLNQFTIIILVVNFYINGLRTPIIIFKSKAGLFAQDKYASLVEGALNFIFSVVMAKSLGIAGVFLGTTLSYILVSFWNQPRILFKFYFKKAFIEYFKDYFIKLLLTFCTLRITIYMSQMIVVDSLLLLFFVRGIICVTISTSIYLVVFFKTPEMRYIVKLFYRILKGKDYL